MRENEKLREKNFYKLLKCIIVSNMHMDSNPTAPMVREANRGAVFPTAEGERGLGQGRVCGGQSLKKKTPRTSNHSRPGVLLNYLGSKFL